MSKIKNTIEINGKIYDAHTGKHLGGADRLQDIIHQEVKQTRPKQDILPPVREPKRQAHLNRDPQKSTTLMRPVVKKPAVAVKQQTKAKSTERVKLGTPHHERIKRAEKVEKSPKIKRFNVHASSSAVRPKVPVRAAQLEVKEPAPVHKGPESTRAHNDWPVVDQFEKALQSASSHLEEFIDDAAASKRGRRLSYAAISLVAVLAIGFGAYQAVPTVKVKLAGNKAGFSADVPNYSPAGFGMSGSDAKAGEVTLSYKSRSDDKGFKITQSPSKWSSQSLVSNYLDGTGKKYETIHSNGKTIYTYDKVNATWVDGGIWFKVESNADLSNEQLIKIANGL